MLRRPLVAAMLMLAASACGGAGDTVPTVPATTEARPLLSETSFEQVVAAKLGREDIQAEPVGDLTLRAADGLDAVVADLSDSYGKYRADPSRRDEVVAAAAKEVETRLAGGLAGESYERVKQSLMPLLEPAFALRGLRAEPATKPFAADLSLVYVADRDGGRLLVSAADAERWGVTVDQLDRVAQANLVRRTEPLLCEEQLCGWASGDGYDATRLTSSKLRRDIAGQIGKAVYAVPRTDVFVALPVKYATRIRQKVLQQFTQATEPVSPKVFVEQDGRIVEYPPA